MTTITTRMLRMSVDALQKHLIAKQYPPKLVSDTVARFIVLKNEQRKQRIKRTMSGDLWEDLLAPARTELANARTMRGQAKRANNTQRYEVMSVYITSIAALIERLGKVQRAGEQTPKQFAQTLRNAGKHVAGDGTHWTDWVSAREKERIEHLFNGLPPPLRGKRKEPFERKVSVLEAKRQRMNLLQRLNSEEELAQRDYEMATDVFERERLSKLLDDMQHAHFALDKLSPTAPAPRTWRGLLGQSD